MTSRTGLVAAAGLLRRGGTLLKESCPKCGGVQVRYRSRTFCTNCDDLSDLELLEAPQPSDVVADLRTLITAKIRETSLLLKEEKDVERQTHLANLLLRYVELVEKTTSVSEEMKKT